LPGLEEIERDESVLANSKKCRTVGTRRAAVNSANDGENTLEMLLVTGGHSFPTRPKVHGTPTHFEQASELVPREADQPAQLRNRNGSAVSYEE
jgi:hypothetical protein